MYLSRSVNESIDLTNMVACHFKGLPVNVLCQQLLSGQPPLRDVRILSLETTEIHGHASTCITNG